jgi:hypothetical protein
MVNNFSILNSLNLPAHPLFKSNVFSFILFVCIALLIIIGCNFPGSNTNHEKRAVPVIYTTDLFHPPGDMDDQVDLAALYAIKGIDLKAIVLDAGKTQEKRPGRLPVSQINYLTKRKIPTSIGLGLKLKSPWDPALWQSGKYQNGVHLILETLSRSEKKVAIVTVGSLRDVAAAFNRNPQLFRDKVSRLFIFAGEATKEGFSETNVKMDRHAFVRIMQSELPVFWVPCFDGGRWQNHGRASHWLTNYQKILKNSSAPLLQYFIYAYIRSSKPPIEFLYQPVNAEWKKKLFKKQRNLWGASVFLAVANKGISIKSGYPIVSMTDETGKDDLLFDFVPVRIRVTERGEVLYDNQPSAREVMQFRVKNGKNYRKAMTQVTARLLSTLQ